MTVQVRPRCPRPVMRRLARATAASLIMIVAFWPVGQSLAASPLPSPLPSPAPWTHCPFGGSGPCLGPLDAGTYRSLWFTMPLTYTVPAGWANVADLTGEFVLLPPGEDKAGIDPGTANYIGIYPDVFPMLQDCSEKPDTSVGRTAKDLATWMATLPGVKPTEPVAVTVGGLKGYYVDAEMNPAWTQPCPWTNGQPNVSLIMGDGVISDLEHGLGPGLAYRYYFLDGRYPLAIEVGYTPRQQTFEEYLAQVEPVIASLGITSRAIGSPATLPPDGTYRKTVSVDDLLAAGADYSTAARNAATIDLTISGGDITLDFTQYIPTAHCAATQSVQGDVVMVHFTGGCGPDFGFQWSAEGDGLRLSAPDDPGFYTALIGGTWTRVTPTASPS